MMGIFPAMLEYRLYDEGSVLFLCVILIGKVTLLHVAHDGLML